MLSPYLKSLDLASYRGAGIAAASQPYYYGYGYPAYYGYPGYCGWGVKPTRVFKHIKCGGEILSRHHLP